MAGTARTGVLSWPDRQRSQIDDDTERMKVLSALLGCLIVAEQTDCDRSMFAQLLDSTSPPRTRA